jgi:hypothetical protein
MKPRWLSDDAIARSASRDPMVTERSKAEFTRLVESAVAAVCGLPRAGLWFCVNELKVCGAPPDRIEVWATLQFTAEGSPFCCGEAQCHLGLFAKRLVEVGEHLRCAMGLRQPVSVEFHPIAVRYNAGVEFHYGAPFAASS